MTLFFFIYFFEKAEPRIMVLPKPDSKKKRRKETQYDTHTKRINEK